MISLYSAKAAGIVACEDENILKCKNEAKRQLLVSTTQELLIADSEEVLIHNLTRPSSLCSSPASAHIQAEKFLALPSNVILIIVNFLDYQTQIKLSHVSKGIRSHIDEKFWERKIEEQNYLLWDASLPKLKIFIANYLYYKGFGRAPKLEEKIVFRLEDVKLLPNPQLAEKSLKLGFPKGQENYKQAHHKMTMLKVDQSKRKTFLYPSAPYQSFMLRYKF